MTGPTTLKTITARDLLQALQALPPEALDKGLSLDSYDPEWGSTSEVAVGRVGLTSGGGVILSYIDASDIEFMPTNVATPILQVD